MDHHCDFIDNCVGIKNQKFFINFLLFSIIYCIYVIGLIILKFIMFFINIFDTNN
jgi:palmitoyltransferase